MLGLEYPITNVNNSINDFKIDIIIRFQVQRDYQMLLNTMRYHKQIQKEATPIKGIQR